MNGTGFNFSLRGLNTEQRNGVLTFQEASFINGVLEAGVSTVLQIISIVGNCLSLIVFYKLGYKETVNISLTFICLLDFARCLFSLLFSLHYPLQLISPVLSKTWFGVGNVTLSMWSIAGSFVSIMYAAHVSLERCLCVSIPFSVKDWLTPGVVWINNILITLAVFVSFFVMYSCYTIDWVFDLELNTTIAITGLNSFYFENQHMRLYITFVPLGWTVLALCIICVCTVIISYHLRQASKFKSSATQQPEGKGTQLSTRDKQVIKMLLLIIGIYIIVTVPRIVFNLAGSFIPSFFLFGKEHNLFEVCRSAVVTLDFINPTTNFFIFYFMSSQFKKTCQTMLCSKSAKNLGVEQRK